MYYLEGWMKTQAYAGPYSEFSVILLVKRLCVLEPLFFNFLFLWTGSPWSRWCQGHARTVRTQGTQVHQSHDFFTTFSSTSVHHVSQNHFKHGFLKPRQESSNCSFFPSLQGDRGFDGLAGLPGEKGHRVSLLVALWKSVVLNDVQVCVFVVMRVTVKSKCLLS